MDVLQIWNSRIAHWASKGLTGVDLYLALAADHELPAEFSPGELSEITGMEGQVITMQDIYVFHRTGKTADGSTYPASTPATCLACFRSR